MKYNYNEYAEMKRVADKMADGQKLSPRERAIAYKVAQNNYNYNRHNGCMGRRYKDI